MAAESAGFVEKLVSEASTEIAVFYGWTLADNHRVKGRLAFFKHLLYSSLGLFRKPDTLHIVPCATVPKRQPTDAN